MKRLFTLIALACVVGSVNLLAQETITIDFSGFDVSYNANGSHLEIDEDGYLVRLYQTGKPTTVFPEGYISVANPDAWQIGLDQTHGNVSYLQRKENVGDQSVFIHNLGIGDEVTITTSYNNQSTDLQNKSQIAVLGYDQGVANNNPFRILVPGTLELSARANYVGIDKITITKATQSETTPAHYSYDPAFESYDMFWVNRVVTYEQLPAGFNLDRDDLGAVIMINLNDGTPLNKRIALSHVNGKSVNNIWTFNHGNQTQSEALLNQDSEWHNFSVCNLRANDRVQITFHNQAYNEQQGIGNEGYCKIGSKQNGNGSNFVYNGCPGFQDTNNNGRQDEGELSIYAGMPLEGKDTRYADFVSYSYVATADGHMDFALGPNVKLCKVEVYSDNLAVWVDKYNSSVETSEGHIYTSNTSYFSSTGELQTKTHVVPGGLRVIVGGDSEDLHSTVQASPETPVATAYDEEHHKIARNDNSTGLFSGDLTTNLPTLGTFYRFIPEISGTMSVRFYSSSINYIWSGTDGLFKDETNTANEFANNANCPYYLIDVDASGNKTIMSNYNGVLLAGNKEREWNNIQVEAGHTYYFFGAWESTATASNYGKWAWDKHPTHVAGVPKLIDVTFVADKQVWPLAKWDPNATTYDDDLAYVKGYNHVKVKKMSGNIVSCVPYLEGTKLKIKDIEFAEGDVDKAGVVLIEITNKLDEYDRNDPVFAFTVAYDASYHSTSNVAEEQRGHTWDFSTTPLNGLKWNNYDGLADVTAFGTSTANGLLKEEMNWTDIHGAQHSDWTFGYGKQVSGTNYDPQYINHYDMVGDNADMVYDTEGMIVLTSANHNSINNEFGNTVTHTETNDPDRYVGVWPGGEFLIPWLDKDDRVIIWMGSGSANGDQMVFNITNARDAEYKEISATDNYVAGGSHWDGANDPYYRGCYHFFATGDGNGGPADMRFKLVGGTMCKIYKIQIYHGDRINTNEIKGATNDDKFLLTSTDVDPNDANSTSSVSGTYNWTLQYFGKDQKIADGSNSVSNSVVARSGVGIPHAGDALTTSTETDPTAATYNTFTYQHALGQIGTFRMRGKDMEKNMKYVADYGEHNVTVAYQQTMKYPYTWDFRDVTGWGNNSQNFSNEDAIGSVMVSRPSYFDSDNDWDASYEKSSKDLSLWELDVQDKTTYYLRLNSQSGQTTANLKVKDNIFETAKAIDGNQYWANGFIVPETQGLWFYSYDNNRTYNTWGLTNDGLAFNGQNKSILNMVVPNVPAGAAVYLRMETNGNFSDQAYLFKGGNTNCEVYGPVLVDGTINEYIYAILNKGAKRHLTFSIAGYQLKKIAVSTDPKAIGQTGYATESRAHRIDHTLTSYLTGKNIKAYIADYNSDYSKVLLKEIGSSNTGNKMNLAPSAEDDNNACILYHDGGSAVEGGFTDRTVNLFDGGLFHVFVPDMHDAPVGEETTNDVDVSGNILKSYLPTASSLTLDGLANTDRLAANTISGYTNMILSATKYSVKDANSTNTANGYDVFFIRIDPKKGASMKKCSAYIQMDTDELVKLSSNSTNGAKMSIVFADDWFGEINNGIATGIDQVTSNKSQVTSAEWYNLNGQKLNGMPTEKGLYIVNGRKVLVK